jgi:hypothetical protein
VWAAADGAAGARKTAGGAAGEAAGGGAAAAAAAAADAGAAACGACAAGSGRLTHGDACGLLSAWLSTDLWMAAPAVLPTAQHQAPLPGPHAESSVAQGRAPPPPGGRTLGCVDSTGGSTSTSTRERTTADADADAEGLSLFPPLLLRLSARYLVSERRRNLALDPVANFHLRNGAQVGPDVGACVDARTHARSQGGRSHCASK